MKFCSIPNVKVVLLLIAAVRQVFVCTIAGRHCRQVSKINWTDAELEPI